VVLSDDDYWGLKQYAIVFYFQFILSILHLRSHGILSSLSNIFKTFLSGIFNSSAIFLASSYSGFIFIILSSI
jgi:hypothetical protein